MTDRTWMIGTRLPSQLADDTRAALALLRSDAPGKGAVAYDTVLALTEASLRVHFRESLVRLGVGGLTRKTVEVALDLAVRGLRGPMRAVLGGLDDAQFAQLADLLEERIYPDPHAGGA